MYDQSDRDLGVFMQVSWWLLALGGLGGGLLAGLFGIGGGIILVPLLTTLGYPGVQAVGTSSLSVILVALSGSLQNWFAGNLDLQRAIALALPALATAQIGAAIAARLPSHWLLASFGLLLLTNILLSSWRRQLARSQSQQLEKPANARLWLSRVGTGSIAGIMAGLFGIGGGIVMVPLQILLLSEPIKVAIQTSLGAVVATSISSTLGHAWRGNVLVAPGLLLGIGGIVGAQISTRFLPRLGDRVVRFGFNLLLATLAVYMFWQAWNLFSNPESSGLPQIAPYDCLSCIVAMPSSPCPSRLSI